MYRLLIRYGTMCVHRNKFDIKVGDLTSHNFSSVRWTKLSQITDDLHDVPTYCENTETKKLSSSRLINYLKQTLNCPSDVATEIWLKHPEFSERSLNDIKKNVNLLTQKGVSTSVIADNPWMMTLTNATLSSRLRILESMKPKTISDFVPLAIITEEKLTAIKEIAEKEKNKIPEKHRIYRFSKLLHMQPFTISQIVSDRLFMLQQNFEDVEQRMKLLLNYAKPIDVVNNLHAIKRSSNELVSRLALAKQWNIPLYQIHLSEKSWQQLIKRHNETEAILAGRSLAQYYADRLHCDIRTIETLLESEPRLLKSKLNRIEETLDLLNDAGMEMSDIVVFPNVLTMPIEKVKKRIDELQSYGCRRNILSIVCLPTEGYNKFLISLKQQRASEREGRIK